MRRCCVGAGFLVVGVGRSRVGAGSLCWRRLFFSCCGGAVVCCCAAAAAKIWPPKWPRTPHNPILARTSTLRRGTRFLGLFLKCYVRPKIAVQVFPVFWGGWVDRAPRERAQKFRESQKTGPRDHPYQGLTAYRTFLPYPTQEKSCSSLKMAFLASLGLLQPRTRSDRFCSPRPVSTSQLISMSWHACLLVRTIDTLKLIECGYMV